MNKNIFNANLDIYLDFGYLMFPLNLSISSKIEIGEKTFYSKTGYHVSLICLEDFSETDQKKILDFAKNYPLKLNKITNDYRLATQGKRQSIIVCVEIKGLKKLISALNKKFAYSFVKPPTHITLFTPKGQFGIGINSTSEYKLLTSQIDQKDSQRLAKSFKLLSLHLAEKVIDC